MDDPTSALVGHPNVRNRDLAVALTWLVVLGYRLSWKKALKGSRVDWIGATISVNREGVSVTIPEGKVTEMIELTNSYAAKTVIGKKQLQSLAGKYAFILGLMVH